MVYAYMCTNGNQKTKEKKKKERLNRGTKPRLQVALLLTPFVGGAINYACGSLTPDMFLYPVTKTNVLFFYFFIFCDSKSSSTNPEEIAA